MEQTYEWIRRAQAGDAAAKDRLLQENSGLIWSVVGRFRGRGEQEDLYQIGAIGLLKCIDKFDFSYDVKFSTYAVPMILGEIKRFLRDDGTVKVSRGLKELSWRAKRAQETALQEENRELSLQELAQRLGVETEELLLALESAKEVESLYASADGADGALQIIDRLADTTENEKMMERLSLMEALAKLDAKQRQIITMRYFQDRTQADVARCIGISQVQVSRIEKRVLSELRECLQEGDEK
nr:SigB/SigF/SigG family RNA polymerase sigma factor [uncultured Anaerotignum sp.]